MTGTDHSHVVAALARAVEKSEARWSNPAPIGTAAPVTYSFMTEIPAYGTGVTASKIATLSSSQKQGIREAFDAFSKVSGLTFLEVPDAAAGGDIRVGYLHFEGESAQWSGYGMHPYRSGNYHYEMAGDLYLNADRQFLKDLEPGTSGFRLVLHEIGHTLGLVHPHDREHRLPEDEDHSGNTVMSYNINDPIPRGPQPYDIEVLEWLYGSREALEESGISYDWDAADLALETSGSSNGDHLVGINLVDRMNGGAGDDVLYGEAGEDVLHGGSGADRLLGGTGDDVLRGGAGGDVLDGGNGIDMADYRDSAVSVQVDLNSGEADGGNAAQDRLLSVESIAGSDHAGGDRLTGNEQGNVLDGGLGADELYGLGGEDLLLGGAGHDALSGGAGADTLIGGAERDLLDGGAGSDVYVLTVAGDSPASAASRDRIEGWDGADRIDLTATDADGTRPGHQNFGFIGSLGPSEAASVSALSYHHEGGDTIVQGRVDEQAGPDFEIEIAGVHVLTESNFIGAVARPSGWQPAQDDARFALKVPALVSESLSKTALHVAALAAASNAGQPKIGKGTAGDDYFLSGVGDDLIEGGAGNDTISYADRGAVRADLKVLYPLDTIGAGIDEIRSIENIIGSGWNDNLAGNAEDNVIHGRSGRDTIKGYDGNDYLIGGNDIDWLLGGAGDDVLIGGSGDDIIEGEAGSDTVSYEGTDAVYVRLWVSGGQTTFGAGRDILKNVENLSGSDANDNLSGDASGNVLTGKSGQDTLDGRQGDDTLDGGEATDALYGGKGNDLLLGGDGDDILDGGSGDDTLCGGAGADHFLFSGGSDIVTDFDSTADRLSFAGLNLRFDQLQIDQVASDTEIDYGSGSVLLADVSASLIGADEFIF